MTQVCADDLKLYQRCWTPDGDQNVENIKKSSANITNSDNTVSNTFNTIMAVNVEKLSIVNEHNLDYWVSLPSKSDA